LKSFFSKRDFWNAKQRNGMFIMAFILWIVAAGSYAVYVRKHPVKIDFEIDSTRIAEWRRLKRRYDSLRQPRIYPFYPDYLTDYRAYVLGIDTVALRRIKDFRKTGQRFKSKEHFKQVSGISDSLYAVLEPYIRIWRTNSVTKRQSFREKTATTKPEPVVKKDLNTATAEDLKRVYGIGDVLSKRIVKYRQKLGGFTIREQLKDVYALLPEAYENLWKYFEIKTPAPVPFRINVNAADIQELRRNPYIDFDLAEKIVEYRSLHGKFGKLEELKKIPGFPADKYERIVLYLRIN